MTFYEILLNLARGVTNWKCSLSKRKNRQNKFFLKIFTPCTKKPPTHCGCCFFCLFLRNAERISRWKNELYLLKNSSNPKTKALFQCCFSWFSEVNVVYFSWNIKRLIEKMMFSPFLTSPIVWPQWWSFADVSQQGLHFSKKISKRKIFFRFDFHWCSQGP